MFVCLVAVSYGLGCVLVGGICGWFVFGGLSLILWFLLHLGLIRICGFVAYCWCPSELGFVRYFGMVVFVCLGVCWCLCLYFDVVLLPVAVGWCWL